MQHKEKKINPILLLLAPFLAIPHMVFFGYRKAIMEMTGHDTLEIIDKLYNKKKNKNNSSD